MGDDVARDQPCPMPADRRSESTHPTDHTATKAGTSDHVDVFVAK
jgi:hypothetical protein